MVEIGDTVVSFDLFEQQFCCDLGVCRGQCCVEGDSGAPLEMDEVAELEAALPVVWNDLSDAARRVIEDQSEECDAWQGDSRTTMVGRGACREAESVPVDGVC